jgi:hypothetical protein
LPQVETAEGRQVLEPGQRVEFELIAPPAAAMPVAAAFPWQGNDGAFNPSGFLITIEFLVAVGARDFAISGLLHWSAVAPAVGDFSGNRRITGVVPILAAYRAEAAIKLAQP